MNQNLEFKKGEYISIYEFAKIIGKNVEILKQIRHRRRFMKYINNLPAGMIQKIELKESIEVDKNYPTTNVMYSVESVDNFIKEHITKGEVLKLLDGNYSLLQRIEKEQKIPLYVIGQNLDFKFYPRKIIDEIFLISKKEEYLTIYEIAQTKFGKNSNDYKFIRDLITSIDKFVFVN